MQYKALIFDLDGTLLDTLDDLADAGNRSLAKMGFATHDVSAYRYFVGDGLKTLITRILPAEHRQEEVVLQAMDYFHEDYGQNWQVKTKMYDGVESMLNSLHGAGAKLSILSNKPDAFTQDCVETMLPHWNFYPLFGQRKHVAKKPDPAGALEIASILGLEMKEILYVGDTATDMITAKGAGMDRVGVLWGFREADELKEAGATHLIESPDQLPALFLHQ